MKSIPWTADYKPPAPPDENTMTKKTPEEIEREIKLQEMELQKLVLVDLKLPSSALWFEPPTIVRFELINYNEVLARYKIYDFPLFFI